MQKRIEQYLNRATRGLWGKKRQEVKTELHSHIYERMHYHMAFGKSEEEALGLALHALGKPSEVSRGLFKLHALPALGKITVLTGLMSMALVTQAQQRLIDVFTKSKVCTQDTCNSLPVSYIEADALVQSLTQQHVPATLQNAPDGGMLLSLPNASPIYFNTKAVLEKNGKHYLSLDTLIESISIEHGFSLKHLNNPEFTYQNSSFRIGSTKTPYNAVQIYQHLIAGPIYNLTGATLVSGDAATALNIHDLILAPSGAQEGTVYALLQPAPKNLFNPSIFEQAFTVQYAEVQQGTLKFRSMTEHPRFGALQSLGKDSVLLKITGQINYWQNKPPFEVVDFSL